MQPGIRAALLGKRKPPTPARLSGGQSGLAQAQPLPGVARRSPGPAAAPAAAADSAESDTSEERPSKQQKLQYNKWSAAQKSFALKKLANFKGKNRQQPCQQLQLLLARLAPLANVFPFLQLFHANSRKV